MGQTSLTPVARREQHIHGPHKSRSIRHCDIGKLRPDLYELYNPIQTREKALEMEAWFADKLRSDGYMVEGGH